MKSAALALAIATMLTVEQRDANRLISEHASVAVSADGRFVAFTTYSRLVTADTDEWSDIYVLDRERQRVTLESADTAGFVGDGSHPGISGDGRYVVFERANGVMLRDRRDGVTRVIAAGRQPVITDAGHLVVFAAGSHDRAHRRHVNGQHSDVYAVVFAALGAPRERRDVRAGSAARGEHASSASRDGRFVALVEASTLRRRKHSPHVFVRDTELAVTTLVGAGWRPSLSGEGHFVAFVGLPHRVRTSSWRSPHRPPASSRTRAARSRQRHQGQTGDVVRRTLRRVSVGGQRSRRGSRISICVGRIRLRPHHQRHDPTERR